MSSKKNSKTSGNKTRKGSNNKTRKGSNNKTSKGGNNKTRKGGNNKTRKGGKNRIPCYQFAATFPGNESLTIGQAIVSNQSNIELQHCIEGEYSKAMLGQQYHGNFSSVQFECIDYIPKQCLWVLRVIGYSDIPVSELQCRLRVIDANWQCLGLVYSKDKSECDLMCKCKPLTTADGKHHGLALNQPVREGCSKTMKDYMQPGEKHHGMVFCNGYIDIRDTDMSKIVATAPATAPAPVIESKEKVATATAPATKISWASDTSSSEDEDEDEEC